MPTAFDNVLLDTFYSEQADGGPEFATAVIRSGPGGIYASRAETIEDYQSKYEISYSDLKKSRQQALRQFAILRKGQARGFLFLAPDENELDTELVGKLNPTTGEIDLCATANGVLTDFYLIKRYADATNSYIRRIVKPSPYDDVVIEMGGESVTLEGTRALLADESYFDDPVEGTITVGVTDYDFTLDYRTGIIAFDTPPVNGWTIEVSCVFHLPAVFTDDWNKFDIDQATTNKLRVGLRELLPIELGLV